jgi:hypothetical protein
LIVEQLRSHYFPENDETVFTGMCPNGQYGAYLEREDGRVRGYGHTRLAAIADLVESLDLPDAEPFDHSAARADHIVSLRREA